MSEKEKNIITINRKKLSPKEVKEKQQLGKILKHHRQITKRPIYRKKRFYFILFVIAVIAYLIYLEEKEHSDQNNTKIENTK